MISKIGKEDGDNYCELTIISRIGKVHWSSCLSVSFNL